MSLLLESGEACPYGKNCQYNSLGEECLGARKDRNTRFTCSFVKNGKIIEGGSRNRYDQTGKMKIITG